MDVVVISVHEVAGSRVFGLLLLKDGKVSSVSTAASEFVLPGKGVEVVVLLHVLGIFLLLFEFSK